MFVASDILINRPIKERNILDGTSLLQKIAELGNSLSNKQLILAEYIVENYTNLAYATITELARLAGVSETTVVRLAYRLGYKSFPEFKAALRAELEAQKNTPTMSKFDIEKGAYKFPDDIPMAIFSLEMQIMKETLAALKTEDFNKAVDMVYKADSVIIAGSGANVCCTRALLFALQAIRPRVCCVEKLDITEEAYIRDAGEHSVCVVFSMPRYPSETQKIVKFTHSRKIPIVGFSNTLLSPIFPYCSIFLQVPTKYITYINPNATYMAFIHALTFGVCKKNVKNARTRLEEYNSFVREIGYYENGEMDLVDTKFE